LHIVHWNSTKYKSFQEAAGHPDGLGKVYQNKFIASAHKIFKFPTFSGARSFHEGEFVYPKLFVFEIFYFAVSIVGWTTT
jgi:Eukaryotic-type carbonic anhydrase